MDCPHPGSKFGKHGSKRNKLEKTLKTVSTSQVHRPKFQLDAMSDTDLDSIIDTDPVPTRPNILNLWRELGYIVCRNGPNRRRVSSPRTFPKDRERNFMAALCSTVTVIVLSIALVEPYWIYIHGGGCDQNYIGAIQFFYNGHFTIEAHETYHSGIRNDLKYHYTPTQVMVNCVSVKAVKLMKLTICLTFVAIIFSFGGFILDVVGPTKRVLQMIRRNALPSIFTAILCVIINGFCYWITVEIDTLQNSTKLHAGTKVVVSFGMSFYLITACGGVSVIGTAFNCLRRKRSYRDHPIDNLSDHERLLAGPCVEAPTLENLTDPPAYSP